MLFKEGIETKQQQGRPGSGHQICCCLVSFHFLCEFFHNTVFHTWHHTAWHTNTVIEELVAIFHANGIVWSWHFLPDGTTSLYLVTLGICWIFYRTKEFLHFCPSSPLPSVPYLPSFSWFSWIALTSDERKKEGRGNISFCSWRMWPKNFTALDFVIFYLERDGTEAE